MATENNNPYKDVQTEKRIHEHLTNQNDMITEEDISNAKVDLTRSEPLPPGAPTTHSPLNEGEEETSTPEPGKGQGKHSGRTDDPGIETPWNLLQ